MTSADEFRARLEQEQRDADDRAMARSMGPEMVEWTETVLAAERDARIAASIAAPIPVHVPWQAEPVKPMEDNTPQWESAPTHQAGDRLLLNGEEQIIAE